jgi:hypothetical protein
MAWKLIEYIQVSLGSEIEMSTNVSLYITEYFIEHLSGPAGLNLRENKC